jgi:FSR family fosmidomycin resistance protein-like MFS transporter
MVNRFPEILKVQALGTFSVGGNTLALPLALCWLGLFAYKYDIHGLVLFGIVNLVLAG